MRFEDNDDDEEEEEGAPRRMLWAQRKDLAGTLI